MVACDHRGHGDLTDRADAAVYRLLPGGCAEYAELQPVARAWTRAQAGADEARHRGDDRRGSVERGVYSVGRQLRPDAVRAWYSNVRDLYAKHDGYLGDSCAEEVDASAGVGRPVAWRWDTRPGATDGAGERC